MHKSIWYSLNFAHVNQLDRHKSNDRPFPIAGIASEFNLQMDTPIQHFCYKPFPIDKKQYFLFQFIGLFITNDIYLILL